MYEGLKKIVKMFEEEKDKVIYQSDASRIKGITQGIVYPTSAEQIHKIIIYARRNKVRLTVRGAATNWVGSCVPANSIVIDTSRFCKVRYDNLRKYAVVEPGASLHKIKKLTEKEEIEFPIELESNDAATIGGMISTNALGKKEMLGRIEEWLMEVELIDGFGKYHKLTGRSTQKVVGSEGKIGVIIGAKLRLNKKLETNLKIIKGDTISEVIEDGADAVNKNTLRAWYLDKKISNLLELEDNYHIILEQEGEEGDEELKLKLDKIYPILGEMGYTIKEDLTFENNMGNILYWLDKNDIPTYGSIITGIIHPCLQEERDDLKEEVKRLGGKLYGKHGFGLKKKELKSFTKIKQEYDPDKIFT